MKSCGKRALHVEQGEAHESNLFLAPTAAKDLRKICEFIAADSPDAADRVRDEIHANIRMLCDMPTVGHQRSDVKDKTLRFWSVFSYVIAYRHTKNEVRIARIIHGHRDFKKIFRSR